MSAEMWFGVVAIASVMAFAGAIAFALRRRHASKEKAAHAEELRTDDILRTAFDRSQSCIGFMTGDGHWLEVNPRFTTVLGYGKSDLIMMPMRLMTHADDRRREAPLFADLRAGRRAAYVIIKRLQRKSGEFRTCRVQMLRCSEGTQNIYQCTIEDVEQNGTWLELVGSALAEVPSTAVIICDASGTITSWSRGAEELLGHPETEILGRKWSTLLEKDDQQNASRLLTAAAQGGFMKSTAMRVRSNGSPIRVQSIIIPDLRLGDVNGFIEVCTEETAAGMVRVEAEELAALQRLRSSIETKISSFGAAASELERLQADNTALQAHIAKKEETEAQLRAGVSMLRNANADLSRKVKILSAAVRKMVIARKGDVAAQQAAPSGARTVVADAEPHWMNFTGGDVDEIVRRTARLQESGVLRLRSERGEKRLVFEEGQLVACTSDSDDRLLGQLLVDAGIIDEQQRRSALEAHRASGTPFGSSIIELGMATQEDLSDIMRTKVTNEISDASSWPKGEFTFVPNEPIARGMVPVALDILAMLDELEEENAMVPISAELDVTAAARPDNGDATQEAAAQFIGRNGKKNRTYHRSTCKTVKNIPKKERVAFTSAADAEKDDYAPCARCMTPPDDAAP